MTDQTPRREQDPSALTTDQLRREINALDTLLTSKIEAVQKAQEVFAKSITDVPTIADRSVASSKAVIDEQFNTIYERFKTVDQQFRGIENQFLERDVRVKDSAAAATTAVNAALQAAKEAVGEQNKSFTLSIDKSEKSTLEQINQQRILLQTNYGALNDKITAIDTRLTRFEGLGLGTAAALNVQYRERTEHVTGERFNMTTAISLVALAIVIIVDILARAVPMSAP